MTDMQNLRGTIVKYMDCMAMNREETALALGMSKGTFRSRLNDPTSFTVGELQLLMMRLQIPPDELFSGITPDGRTLRKGRVKS